MVRLGVVWVHAGYSQKEAVGKPELLSSPSWYISDPCLRRKLGVAHDAPQTTIWREPLSATSARQPPALGVRNSFRGHCGTLDFRFIALPLHIARRCLATGFPVSSTTAAVLSLDLEVWTRWISIL